MAYPSHLAFRSIANPIIKSNLPSHQKEGILEWYRRLTAKTTPHEQQEALQAAPRYAPIVQKDISAAITGAALGLLDAQFKGLDIGKNKNIPVDGLLGAGSTLVALVAASMSTDPTSFARRISEHASNMGADCTAILTYRKFKSWREGQSASTPVPAAVKAAGENIKNDPIAQAAMNL